MPVLKVGPIDIRYRIDGQGPDLVYISGTGRDLRVEPNAFTWPLKERYRVLGFDQRGMGRSGKPDIPYTMADYADDAAGLMAGLGIEKAHVMGVSFGGMVAQYLVLRHPDRVAGLILCCTASGGKGGSSYPLHELAHLPLEERVTRFLELADYRHDAAWQQAHREEFQALVEQRMANFRLTMAEPGASEGARHQLAARKGHDTYDRLPQIKSPTLVLGGQHDRIVPDGAIQTLAEQIPGAKWHLIEGGHLSFLEQPRTWDLIFDFLGGLD